MCNSSNDSRSTVRSSGALRCLLPQLSRAGTLIFPVLTDETATAQRDKIGEWQSC